MRKKRMRLHNGLIMMVLAVGLVVWPTTTHAQTASGTVWNVEYFRDSTATSFAFGGQMAGPIARVWGYGSPGGDVGADWWSARLTTDAYFPAGRYRFKVTVDDGARLAVSGITLFDTTPNNGAGCARYADITLTEGVHQVQVTYVDISYNAFLFVDWEPIPAGNTTQPVYHGCTLPNATTVSGSAVTSTAPNPANVVVAPAPTTGDVVRVRVARLNVRSQPQLGNNKLGVISFGQEFSVTGSAANNWVQIDYFGQTGYVNGQYIAFASR
jgi:hypothetical protein